MQNVRLRFDVIDTGIGIPKSRIGSIFEAFKQADQTTTRRFGGTGLGLAVCKRLMNAMHGDVVVHSVEGKGSCFTAFAEFKIAQAGLWSQLDHSTKKLFVICEKPLTAKNLVKSLKSLGGDAQRLPPQQITATNTIQQNTVLTTSSIVKTNCDNLPPAQYICLTEIGDTQAESLVTSGIVKDLVSLPASRRELRDFALRLMTGEFRGVKAITGATTLTQRETFEGVRVLAADDNAVNREILAEALAGLKIEVDFVENGLEAVKLATKPDASKKYALIFMDGSMPEMDGFTATKQIREHEQQHNTEKLTIIALTAQVHGMDADALSAIGMDECLFKPFSIDKLTEIVRKYCRTSVAKNSDFVEVESNQIGSLPAKAAPQLLDQDTLKTMETLSAGQAVSLQHRMWSLFKIKASECLKQITEIDLNASFESELSFHAHALKSMCLSAGAAHAADLSQKLERAPSKNIGTVQITAMIAELQTVLDATFHAMNAHENKASAKIA